MGAFICESNRGQIRALAALAFLAQALFLTVLEISPLSAKMRGSPAHSQRLKKKLLNLEYNLEERRPHDLASLNLEMPTTRSN